MTQPPNTPQHYGADGRPLPGPEYLQGARRAQDPYPAGQLPPQQPTEPHSRRRVTVPLLLLILGGAFLALVSCGIGGAMTVGAVPAPAPAATVTEPAATGEVPPICKAALGSADLGFDLASKGFRATGQVMGAAEDAFRAIANGDQAGLDAANEKLVRSGKRFSKIADQVKPVMGRYHSQRDECLNQ